MYALCPICHTPLSCVGTCPDRDEPDHRERDPRYVLDMDWREQALADALDAGERDFHL